MKELSRYFASWWKLNLQRAATHAPMIRRINVMKAFAFYPKRNLSLCAYREFFKRENNKTALIFG